MSGEWTCDLGKGRTVLYTADDCTCVVDAVFLNVSSRIDLKTLDRQVTKSPKQW